MAAMGDCPIIGRLVEELEYRLPEEVVMPHFAAIKDDDDKYIVRQIYLKKIEKTLNVLVEIEKLYAITMTNISGRSETKLRKSVWNSRPTARLRIPYLLLWSLFRFINWLQLVILWSMLILLSNPIIQWNSYRVRAIIIIISSII